MTASYSNLVKLKDFLKRFPRNDHPAAFEFVVSSAFSEIFHLPFQCLKNKDDTIPYRVIWYGDIDMVRKTVNKSRSNPDAVCSAYGFYIIIEATLREGKNQWSKEIVPCLAHYDNFVSTHKVNPNNLYLVFVTPKIHKLTYSSLKKVWNTYNPVLLETPWLAKLWDATRFVPSIRHLDYKGILKEVNEALPETPSFERFKKEVSEMTARWRKKILTDEKTVFFALRAYEAMHKTEGEVIATSQILKLINRDSIFNRYWELIGKVPLDDLILKSLISERMAKLAKIPTSEKFFCKVEISDYIKRGERVIEAVKEIDG